MLFYLIVPVSGHRTHYDSFERIQIYSDIQNVAMAEYDRRMASVQPINVRKNSFEVDWKPNVWPAHNLRINQDSL